MLRLPLSALAFVVGVLGMLGVSAQPPGGADKKGPPGEGKKGGMPKYELGKLFPPQLLAELNLTAEQRDQITVLEKDAKERLEKLLTAKQKQQILDSAGRRGPGGGGPPMAEPAGPIAKAAFGNQAENPAPKPPDGLTPIGGRWYVKESKPNTYFYRDANRFYEPFTNLNGDSNKDGIPDCRLSHDATALIVETQNLPNHPTGTFPNSGNPNAIKSQRFTFRIPLVPKPAEQITRVPMGEIGLAVNGVVFFNPFEAGGMNAVSGYSEEWFDSCCGHPQQTGVYHYHKYPSCVKSPFVDDGKQHSPVIGFAWDGYPVYGPYDAPGVMAKDLTGAAALDACNGHFDADRGYHYHATPGKFPYMLGGYAGVVEARGRRPGPAGPGAIRDNASGTDRHGKGIVSITPGTASRGKIHTIRFELLADTAPAGIPKRVVVGPFEANKLTREGSIVTAEVIVPGDIAAGSLYDCHLEFAGGRSGTTVLKRNDAFRVIE